MVCKEGGDMILDRKLTPELEGILKEAHAKTANKKKTSRLQDRGAPFVWLPDDTQHAIVRLVLETTKLSPAPVVVAMRRELEVKDAWIAELQKEPAELAELLAQAQARSLQHCNNLTAAEAFADKLHEELVDHRKRADAEDRKKEVASMVDRRHARKKIIDETQGADLGQRYDAALIAMQLYVETLLDEKDHKLDRKLVRKHLKVFRTTLTQIDESIS